MKLVTDTPSPGDTWSVPASRPHSQGPKGHHPTPRQPTPPLPGGSGQGGTPSTIRGDQCWRLRTRPSMRFQKEPNPQAPENEPGVTLAWPCWPTSAWPALLCCHLLAKSPSSPVLGNFPQNKAGVVSWVCSVWSLDPGLQGSLNSSLEPHCSALGPLHSPPHHENPLVQCSELTRKGCCEGSRS